MDQRKKIQTYVNQVKKIYQENPEFAELRNSNFDEYERKMGEKLSRFKEDYRTLFKLAIKEFDKESFITKLNHFLNITQNVLNGRVTLEEATKQVANEQYKEYVEPLVEKKENNK